jgi:hypothetical protein
MFCLIKARLIGVCDVNTRENIIMKNTSHERNCPLGGVKTHDIDR